MKKIKLFAAQSIQALETEINRWLTSHKGIHIIETNITSLSKENTLRSAKEAGDYAFYILYTPEEENEDQSVLSAAKQLPSELIEPGNLLTESN